jgi:hypothetical protein
MRLFPLLTLTLLQVGCLEAPAGGEGGGVLDGAADGAPGADALDADPDAPDADPQSSYYGTYAVVWTLIGDDCVGLGVAADRVDLAADSIAFWSDGCPAVELESQAASWVDNEIVVQPIQLESCPQDTYEALQLFRFVADGSGLGLVAPDVGGWRRRVSDNAVLCTFRYTVSGTKL